MGQKTEGQKERDKGEMGVQGEREDRDVPCIRERENWATINEEVCFLL